MIGKTFVPLTGQYDNIGDILHRRVLLNWLSDVSDPHVLIGKAPDSFVEALRLDKHVVTYRSPQRWLYALIRMQGNSSFVFKPGQMRCGVRRLLGELALYPILSSLRSRNRTVIRPGVEAKYDSEFIAQCFSPLFRFTDVSWRDRRSAHFYRFGQVVPDLVFGNFVESHDNQRRHIAISMRHDRTPPSTDWYDCVQCLALDFSRDLIVVSQVRSDNKRNNEIAKTLGCPHVGWSDSKSHIDQEERVVNVYSHSDFVISDRLHALILASNYSAHPVGFLTESNDKVYNHFSVVGINNSSLVAQSGVRSKILSTVRDYTSNLNNYQSKLALASERVRSFGKEVQRALKSS